MELHQDPAADLLRAVGLKVTRGRVAALTVLGDHSHSTAEQLHAHLAEGAAPMTLQAVYLSLQVLTDHGLLRRIEPAGSPARYEIRVGDNHHHLVCTGCSRVVDIDCLTGGAPCLHPADTHGFSVAQAEITFWGVCPDCAAIAAQTASHAEGAR